MTDPLSKPPTAPPTAPSPPEPAARAPRPDAKAERLAEALRANLRRRKAQARGRLAADDPPGGPTDA